MGGKQGEVERGEGTAGAEGERGGEDEGAARGGIPSNQLLSNSGVRRRFGGRQVGGLWEGGFQEGCQRGRRE